MGAILNQITGRSNLWIDKFQRAALGNTYSVVRGSADISSNELRCNTDNTYNDVMALKSSGSINQWIYSKLPIGFTGGHVPLWYFRFIDISNPMYTLIYLSGSSQWVWQFKNSTPAAATGVSGATAISAVADGDGVGFTLNGTGTGTRLRGFLNPVRATPLSAANWDSGDTPIFDFPYVAGAGGSTDLGFNVGFGGYPLTPNAITFNEFRFGLISP